MVELLVSGMCSQQLSGCQLNQGGLCCQLPGHVPGLEQQIARARGAAKCNRPVRCMFFVQVMFSKPLPDFSCRLNAFATAVTCQWLMGPCKVNDVELDDGTVRLCPLRSLAAAQHKFERHLCSLQWHCRGMKLQLQLTYRYQPSRDSAAMGHRQTEHATPARFPLVSSSCACGQALLAALWSQMIVSCSVPTYACAVPRWASAIVGAAARLVRAWVYWLSAAVIWSRRAAPQYVSTAARCRRR